MKLYCLALTEISVERYLALAKELGEPGNQFLSNSEAMLELANSGKVVRLEE